MLVRWRQEERPESNNGFIALAKEYGGLVTVALSFLGLVVSATNSLLSDITMGAVSLLVGATLLLLTYNIWLARAARRLSITAPSWRQGPRYRWTVHSVTIVLLLASWSLVAVLASDKYASELFFRLGKPQQGIARLKNHIVNNNADMASHKKLAEAYLEQKQYPAYFDTLEKLIDNKQAFDSLPGGQRSRELGNLHFDLGWALLAEEYVEGMAPQDKRALYHLKSAHLLLGDNPPLLIALGATIARVEAPSPQRFDTVRGHFQKARARIESFEDARLREEGLILYHHFFGKALRRLGRYEDAAKELRAAHDLAVMQKPKAKLTDSILFQMGEVEYLRTRDISTAKRHWDQISSEGLRRRFLRMNGFAFWARGVEFANSGQESAAAEQFRTAEEFLSQALQLGETSPRIYLQLGNLYFSRRDYRQATAMFERLIQEWPSQQLGQYWLGRSRFAMEELEKADVALAKATSMDPQHRAARYWLGRVKLERKEWEAARDLFHGCLETGQLTDDAHAQLMLALLYLAENAGSKSDTYIALHEEALRIGQEGVGTATKSASALRPLEQLLPQVSNQLAYAYAQRKINLPLALKYVDSALAADPESPHFLDTKAWILILGAERAQDSSSADSDFRRAEKMLNAALKRLPAGPDTAKAKADTLYHLGYLHQVRGRQDIARKYFLDAVSAHPGHEEAKRALQ